MKKFLAALMVLCMVFALTACSGGGQSTSTPAGSKPASTAQTPNATAAEKPIKIGVSLARADEFNLGLESCYKALDAADDSVEILVTVAQNSQSQQYAEPDEREFVLPVG